MPLYVNDAQIPDAIYLVPPGQTAPVAVDRVYLGADLVWPEPFEPPPGGPVFVRSWAGYVNLENATVKSRPLPENLAGDLMIMSLRRNGSNNPPIPAGWQSLPNTLNTSRDRMVYRVSSGGEETAETADPAGESGTISNVAVLGKTNSDAVWVTHGEINNTATTPPWTNLTQTLFISAKGTHSTSPHPGDYPLTPDDPERWPEWGYAEDYAGATDPVGTSWVLAQIMAWRLGADPATEAGPAPVNWVAAELPAAEHARWTKAAVAALPLAEVVATGPEWQGSVGVAEGHDTIYQELEMTVGAAHPDRWIVLGVNPTYYNSAVDYTLGGVPCIVLQTARQGSAERIDFIVVHLPEGEGTATLAATATTPAGDGWNTLVAGAWRTTIPAGYLPVPIQRFEDGQSNMQDEKFSDIQAHASGFLVSGHALQGGGSPQLTEGMTVDGRQNPGENASNTTFGSGRYGGEVTSRAVTLTVGYIGGPARNTLGIMSLGLIDESALPEPLPGDCESFDPPLPLLEGEPHQVPHHHTFQGRPLIYWPSDQPGYDLISTVQKDQRVRIDEETTVMATGNWDTSFGGYFYYTADLTGGDNNVRLTGDFLMAEVCIQDPPE